MDRVNYADFVSASTRARSFFFYSFISILLQVLQQLVLFYQQDNLPFERDALISGVPVVLVEIIEFVPLTLLRRHPNRSVWRPQDSAALDLP